MNRAEMRRKAKEASKAKNTYTFTKEQLDRAIKEGVAQEVEKAREEAKQQATEEAVGVVLALMLTIPLEVLMDHYWTKTYAKRLPQFVNYVLEYYNRWERGELDMEELKKDLWEYGGVKLDYK